MEPILTLRNAGFRYGSSWAVRGVDLDVFPGEMLGMLARTDRGKPLSSSSWTGYCFLMKERFLFTAKA